jgi:hypothetical protein
MASDQKLSSTWRLLALAGAIAAALAIGWFAIATAGASSGGIGSAGPSGTAEERSADRGRAKYDRLWDRVSVRDKRWAHRTSECESGGNPKAIGGGGRYRGAFQFMRSTWKSSPKSPGGDPVAYPYRTQALVAVLLKRRDGAGHWPVCG